MVKRARSGGAVTWYGRVRDPGSGRWSDENLTALGLTTAEQRAAWARKRSEELRGRVRAAALGVSRTSPGEAARLYMDDVRARLRPNTAQKYGTATREFTEWVSRARRFMSEVTPADLWHYRSLVVRQSVEASSASTRLAMLSAALEWWRRAGIVSVTRDDIRDACRKLPASSDVVRPLTRDQIRAVVAASIAHEDWRATALVVLALLTGCRVGELQALPTSEVDLAGAALRLGDWVKTHRGRVVDLSICPGALAVLGAMPPAHPTIWGEALDRSYVKDHFLKPMRYAAPWNWRRLRLTCATYLANAPGIWAGSSAYRTARQLGHSVTVAERCYLGLVTVPAEARTLEAAMGAESVVSLAIARVARDSWRNRTTP